MDSTVNRRVEFFRHALGEDELASVAQTLGSVFLTMGPRTREFEEAFAAWTGRRHAVGVSSCSMGLVLALRALGVGPGDEVITTPMTWISTPNAALFLGADPVFVDVDPATGLITPEAVAAAITPKTRAVIVVHLFGQMADMRGFRALADAHGLGLVEDTAHAVESRHDGVRPGQLGDCSVYSFYATKTLTCGDGGALATDDPELAERLRLLRNHGVTKTAAQRYARDRFHHWDMTDFGYKAVLSDVNASLLIPQLPHLEARRVARLERVRRYEHNLSGVAGVHRTPHAGDSAHHLFTVHVDPARRDDVLDALVQRGIGCAVNYPSVPSLTYYRGLGFDHHDWPEAYRFGRSILSLPLWPALPLDDVDHVCETLDAILNP
jgi:dTDP-4-amino-4,6-dideoxygalactose transaminase